MTDVSLLVLVPLLVGLVMVALGLTMSVRRGRRRRDWTRTRGTVAGWRHNQGAGSSGTSVPSVAFVTQDGQEVTASLGYGVDLGIYPTGGEVDVWYDPADPRRVQANVMGTGCVPSALVVLGIAIGAVGVLISSAVL